MSSKVPKPLDKREQRKWLKEHIPHRVRAAIAQLDMRKSVLGDYPLSDTSRHRESDIYWRCATDSIWQGRQAATRWLIEFVGIKQKSDQRPGRPDLQDRDINIEWLDNGALIKMTGGKAKTLASVWKGCSQASSHATHKSKHPPIRAKNLEKALTILLDHLSATIYQRPNTNLKNLVLQLPPKKTR
jgi:hypothetical protein